MVLHICDARSGVCLERGIQNSSLFLCAIIYDARQDVDTFVFEIAMDETGEKRTKLAALQLTEAEWKRVDLFLNLLAVCFGILL